MNVLPSTNHPSKVLQIIINDHQPRLFYAGALEHQEGIVVFRDCRFPHPIRCAITGRDEFYAEHAPELHIPVSKSPAITEIDTPAWWNTTRSALLENLVWLNARPAGSKEMVPVRKLRARVARRIKAWELATTLARDIEDTFFRDLLGPAPVAGVVAARLTRILPLLGSADRQALGLAGLPGLGTNHPINRQLRETVQRAEVQGWRTLKNRMTGSLDGKANEAFAPVPVRLVTTVQSIGNTAAEDSMV